MKKSAGILVYRRKNNKIEVLLVHPGGPYWQNRDLNTWSIPKGEIVSLDSSPEATQPSAWHSPTASAGTSLGKQVNIIKEKSIVDTAIREFEEETGLKLDEEDKQKLIYLGEVARKNYKSKIVYVFILEKDFGDNLEIKSNLIEIEWPPKSGKMIKIPEVDKAGYFDLETARKKLVGYQKEIIDMLIKQIKK